MRWAVLVGGTGSNLRALLQSGFGVDLVVSHKPAVQALDVAQSHQVPVRVLDGREFDSREKYDQALYRVLSEAGIERIAMAGFLRWLTPAFIGAFPGGIVNVHPSLLPAYPGLHAIERAYADRVLWSGVTVHFVDEGHDTGPVLAQVPVERRIDDSLEVFVERIHQAEHALYPRVIRALDEGRVRLMDGRVVYDEGGGSDWMHGR